jgi:rod shape determining protein RodA
VIRLDRRILRSFDWLWFLALIALTGAGIMALWSTTSGTGLHSYFGRQLIFLGCGIAVFLVLLCFDYHLFSDFIAMIYVGMMTVMSLVLLIGRAVYNNKNWLDIGAFSFQPSELAKIVVIVALAKYYAGLDSDHLSFRELATGAAIVFIPITLVLLQGDLGTAVTYFPVYATLSLLAGVRRKHLVVFLLIAIISVPVVWSMMHGYQKQRIETILDPSKDPDRVGYQTIQSMIAIGSGQFWGKGLRQGSQGYLGFLPARHTDFVFSVLAEEKGFVGSVTILALYLFVLSRLYRTVCEARDKIGAMIVSGVAALIFCHAAINIGMVFGVFPVVGIPLPFISAGGSSLITCFIAMGLSMSVRMRRYVN